MNALFHPSIPQLGPKNQYQLARMFSKANQIARWFGSREISPSTSPTPSTPSDRGFYTDWISVDINVTYV